MLQLLGRLHILVLHLPIGFLVLAFLMELAARRSHQVLRPAVGFSLFWGMVSAVVAAGLGYLLSLDGSYDAELLDWHKWLGIATAALAGTAAEASNPPVTTKPTPMRSKVRRGVGVVMR